MDAAIGRLHFSITVARPVPAKVLEPEQDDEHLDRALRRDRAERLAETDRDSWSAVYHTRGRF